MTTSPRVRVLCRHTALGFPARVSYLGADPFQICKTFFQSCPPIVYLSVIQNSAGISSSCSSKDTTYSPPPRSAPSSSKESRATPCIVHYSTWSRVNYRFQGYLQLKRDFRKQGFFLWLLTGFRSTACMFHVKAMSKLQNRAGNS